MWSKLSSALKRPSTPSLVDGDDEPSPSKADVLAGVYEQHPNLSVFHAEHPSEIPFPPSSPTMSPTLNGRKGIFKKPGRPQPPPINTQASEQGVTSPIMSPLLLPKKVKSSLQNLASDVARYGSVRSRPQEATHSVRPSQDSAVSLQDNKPPVTPTTDARYNSLRSILRDRNTPATGQSVRFFSRDAYKLITPDVSSASSEPDEVSFAARLHRANAKPARPVAQELFANSVPTTPSMLGQGMPSMLTQEPPPNVSNIFDLSNEVEMPMIPAGHEVPLLDSAVEISEVDAPNGEERSGPPTPPAKQGMHDRSHSFSFGQTVFRSLTSPMDEARTSTPPPGSSFSKSRGRALSDTVFHSFASGSTKGVPEADINDTSALKVLASRPPSPLSPERPKEKDPFGAYATTFFTPGTVPPTPPNHPTHARKVSREEDNAWRLQTALALKSELCAQYEVDLSARDELVALLQQRLSECEKECERRKGLVKGWRRRVAELEKCVRGLSDEVERSREEASERSVMDEASGMALQAMHRRIGELERECRERERREESVKGEMSMREEELERTRDELQRKEDSEQELQRGIRDAREEMERMQLDLEMSGNHGLPAPAPSMRETSGESDWVEERARLLAENEALRSEQTSLQAQLTGAREETLRRDSELRTLKDELEAQWRHTEEAGEQINTLTHERDTLKAQADALNERVSTMEFEWAQGENSKADLETEMQELLTAKEELERECRELEDQVHSADEQSEELTRALQEREAELTSLTQEKQYTMDRAARFETQLKVRDAEAEEMRERVREAESAKDDAEEDAARMKREHARIVNDQSRRLQEVVAREVEARANFEALLREKGETGVELGALRDRANALQEEVDRLRKQVHALQQESADKEVKLVNLQKQRAQDKEDIQGLNIALDSKQQELELLKRRMSVRGGSATPAAPSKVPPHRRESSIFGTPSVNGSRPSSVLSDTGSTTKGKFAETPSTLKGKGVDTPSTVKPALTRSVRANGAASTATTVRKRSLEGTMGPPPNISRTNSASSTAGAKDATPTRIPSASSSRASIAGPPSAFAKTPTPTLVRRTSVSSRLPATLVSRDREVSASASEADEKEKENSAPKARRMSMLAA
ncbi:uncharacterized protein B0H18DRAFT_929183 [Fomitopsis serialis]|uniref:uncharacterized protein n=1 Tax=Fomitopsis serialis TaxID=139415 RepID=UPI0020083B5C|nr:uncharacterized protein B0H18DRAFT_929183 [Neoantrodia serialis]KAH9932361.1 hypothetical protein B0H18DRAFT_929183 [Neoantrodia serialis]